MYRRICTRNFLNFCFYFLYSDQSGTEIVRRNTVQRSLVFGNTYIYTECRWKTHYLLLYYHYFIVCSFVQFDQWVHFSGTPGMYSPSMKGCTCVRACSPRNVIVLYSEYSAADGGFRFKIRRDTLRTRLSERARPRWCWCIPSRCRCPGTTTWMQDSGIDG